MAFVIKHCTAEKKKKKKKKDERSIEEFIKKAMIPESEISECLEHKVKSKLGKIFVNKKILEEYCVKIYEIDIYFYEHYKELIRVDKMDATTNCLTLIFVFLRINQLQKLIKNT